MDIKNNNQKLKKKCYIKNFKEDKYFIHKNVNKSTHNSPDNVDFYF